MAKHAPTKKKVRAAGRPPRKQDGSRPKKQGDSLRNVRREAGVQAVVTPRMPAAFVEATIKEEYAWGEDTWGGDRKPPPPPLTMDAIRKIQARVHGTGNPVQYPLTLETLALRIAATESRVGAVEIALTSAETRANSRITHAEETVSMMRTRGDALLSRVVALEEQMKEIDGRMTAVRRRLDYADETANLANRQAFRHSLWKRILGRD